VLAQNSPSHYVLLNVLLHAGVQPSEVKMDFPKDAFQAAAAFNADKKYAAVVTWAPDIYNLEKIPGNRMLINTLTANKLIADVWFTRADFARFDYLVAMDEENLRALERLAPDKAARGKLRLLRSFDPSAPRGAAVPDPYYGGDDGFEEVLDICEAACRGLVEFIAQGGTQVQNQSFEVKAWLQPGEVRPVDLPAIARQATAKVIATGDKEGGYGNLVIALVR
jgi:hypothetical protein